jgi:hypothetical protein
MRSLGYPAMKCRGARHGRLSLIGQIPPSAGSNTTKIVFPYALSFFLALLKKSSIPSDKMIALNVNVQEDKDGSENME